MSGADAGRAPVAGQADAAISLPVGTASFSAIQMPPLGRLDSRHLLLLADDVSAEEVEALALSQDPHAGWVGAGRLQVLPGAELHGPWGLDIEMRKALGVPEWAAQVMVLECEPERFGALPPELAGNDPIADAFPVAQPSGTELVVLERLRSIARRLAGGLRLVGDPVPGSGEASTPVLVVPDPEVMTNLTVYGPYWLMPEALEALVVPVAPGAHLREAVVAPPAPQGLDAVPRDELERLVEVVGEDELEIAWRTAEAERQRRAAEEEAARQRGEVIIEARDGYTVVAPVTADERPVKGAGDIEARVHAVEELPIAVASESWADDGVIAYELAWVPEEPEIVAAEDLTRTQQRGRRTARDLIEVVAGVIAPAVEGVVVDDDGFLVTV